MATSEQKEFCVLQFSKTEFSITLQRAFRSGHGNTQDATRIRSLENPYELPESQRNSPKLNEFCAISRWKVFGLSSAENQLLLPISMLYNYNYFLNRKKVNQITSFGSKMVHRLAGSSQYAIG
ncbi:hypothetical protein TNCV_1842301 [Trichonephila clavipes]|nr:hypothetical protein TNCV_1842301 [Trichonephila clavipes]